MKELVYASLVVILMIFIGLFSMDFFKKENPEKYIDYAPQKVATNASAVNNNPQKHLPKTYNLNDQVFADKLIFVVSDVQITNKITNKTSVLETTQNQFLIVKVKITNNDKVPRKIGIGLVALTDGKERIFYAHDRATYWLNQSNRGIFGQYDKVNPGLAVEGSVAFEIPKDANGLKFIAFHTCESPDNKSNYEYVNLGR